MKILLDTSRRNYENGFEDVSWIVFVYGPWYKKASFSFTYKEEYNTNYFYNHLDSGSVPFQQKL